MAGLNLERKLYESVIILTPEGDEIEVEVVRVARNKCHLQFHAPLSIKIARKEVYHGKNGDDNIRTSPLDGYDQSAGLPADETDAGGSSARNTRKARRIRGTT